jgi:hypothetical protein
MPVGMPWNVGASDSLASAPVALNFVFTGKPRIVSTEILRSITGRT